MITQETEKLLTWSKTACEETRAVIGWDEDALVPSWLPELEGAIEEVEAQQ